MTHSVDSNLFPQPHLTLLSRHVNKIATVTDMEDMYVLSSMDFHSPRATYLCAAPEGPIFKKRRPTQSPYMPPYSMVITQIPGGKLITLDHFHQGRDSILFLLEYDTSSEIGFAFPDQKHLKLPTVDLQNISSTSWYST